MNNNEQQEQRLSKNELQHQITRNAKRDAALTDQWLKNRGITAESLLHSETLLLQAQKAAYDLLHLHAPLLKRQKKDWLQDFAHRSKGKRLRKRITDKECYAVLNMAKTVNRQMFKKRRVEQA